MYTQTEYDNNTSTYLLNTIITLTYLYIKYSICTRIHVLNGTSLIKILEIRKFIFAVINL